MMLILAYVLDHVASDNLLCRILRSDPFVRVGTVSYMFYLLHLFVIRIFRDMFSNLLVSHWALNRTLQLTGSLAATLVLAAVSWKYFESPILRLKSRFALVGAKNEIRTPAKRTSPASVAESGAKTLDARGEAL